MLELLWAFAILLGLTVVALVVVVVIVVWLLREIVRLFAATSETRLIKPLLGKPEPPVVVPAQIEQPTLNGIPPDAQWSEQHARDLQMPRMEDET